MKKKNLSKTESKNLDFAPRFLINALITGYQKNISHRKGYRCAHAQCRGGMSCSAFIQNVIQSSPDGHLSPEDKQLIAERLRECKSLSTVAGLSTYQAAKKILLTAGAVGAGVFLISATAFAANCDDSGGGGGCGGSGASGNTPKDCTVINGITVPPEPDAKANAATIAGVDSNNNGIRDDVERNIASISNDNKTHQIYLDLEKNYRILQNEKSSDFEIVSAFKKIHCIILNNPNINADAIPGFIINTNERGILYNHGYAKALQNGFDIDDDNCN